MGDFKEIPHTPNLLKKEFIRIKKTAISFEMAVFYLYVTEGDISRLRSKHITPPKVAYHLPRSGKYHAPEGRIYYSVSLLKKPFNSTGLLPIAGISPSSTLTKARMVAGSAE